jgi:VanZ family protein
MYHWQRPVDRGAIILSAMLIAVITVLSLFPVDQLPRVQGNDKLHHFIAYCAAIFPVAVARRRLALWLSPAIVIYSGLIELLQPFSNRYAEWADFGANTLGVVCGLLVGMLIGPFIMKLLPEKWR